MSHCRKAWDENVGLDPRLFEGWWYSPLYPDISEGKLQHMNIEYQAVENPKLDAIRRRFARHEAAARKLLEEERKIEQIMYVRTLTVTLPLSVPTAFPFFMPRPGLFIFACPISATPEHSPLKMDQDVSETLFETSSKVEREDNPAGRPFQTSRKVSLGETRFRRPPFLFLVVLFRAGGKTPFTASRELRTCTLNRILLSEQEHISGL